MENVLLTQHSWPLIQAQISAAVKAAIIENHLIQIDPEKIDDPLLTRPQAAEFLNISLATLNEWTKQGIVKAYRIASQVRYKRIDLEKSLQPINTGSKRYE